MTKACGRVLVSKDVQGQEAVPSAVRAVVQSYMSANQPSTSRTSLPPKAMARTTVCSETKPILQRGKSFEYYRGKLGEVLLHDGKGLVKSERRDIARKAAEFHEEIALPVYAALSITHITSASQYLDYFSMLFKPFCINTSGYLEPLVATVSMTISLHPSAPKKLV